MKKLSRRTLLRGAGGVAIGLPFLEIMGRGALGVQPASALAGDFPPCAGVALGFDRLVMVAVGAKELNEVRAFPFESRPAFE